MSRVKDHYDGMLGPVYTWILGDFETAYANNAALFDRLGITDGNGKYAVDLGSGPGCQSIPLAERGYAVTAIDFCDKLLSELTERAGELPIAAVCDDILNFEDHIDRPADLVVCMGDTLCHLPDTQAVSALLRRVGANLSPGGRVVVSFRDYLSSEPTGAERFIPVRSSDDQIFTCFVEFKDEVVNIHDILYRRVEGEWQLEVSEYDKIKVDPQDVTGQLEGHGLRVDLLDEGGMIVISAINP